MFGVRYILRDHLCTVSIISCPLFCRKHPLMVLRVSVGANYIWWKQLSTEEYSRQHAGEYADLQTRRQAEGGWRNEKKTKHRIHGIPDPLCTTNASSLSCWILTAELVLVCLFNTDCSRALSDRPQPCDRPMHPYPRHSSPRCLRRTIGRQRPNGREGGVESWSLRFSK